MTQVHEAELRAALARARLHGTVEALQAKIAPAALARSAADSGGRALAAGAEAARANPGKVAGAVALIGAVLGRKRIAALVRKVTGKDETASRTARS